jgi:hypothetical protein
VEDDRGKTESGHGWRPPVGVSLVVGCSALPPQVPKFVHMSWPGFSGIFPLTSRQDTRGAGSRGLMVPSTLLVFVRP